MPKGGTPRNRSLTLIAIEMVKTIGIYQYNVKTTMKLIFGADKTPHVMCQIEEEILSMVDAKI